VLVDTPRGLGEAADARLFPERVAAELRLPQVGRNGRKSRVRTGS